MTENDTLDGLYQDAMAEGGDLVIYAGGDAPEQAAMYHDPFVQRFPEMKPKVWVDLSKYHDARIAVQQTRGALECDVAHLQTLQDFDYWKQHNWLLRWKPPGFDALEPDFADADGAFYPLFAFAFSNVSDAKQVDSAAAPREAADYLRPEFKDRIVLTYPHDDDAVLFLFENIVARHGLDWLDALLKQNPQWVRGTAEPVSVIARGEKAVTFTSAFYLNPVEGMSLRFQLPDEDFFQAWYQLGAIFKDAAHPAAAKLYMAWMLSGTVQAQPFQWPSRTDAPTPADHKPLREYANASPAGFRDFMRNRDRVERFKGVMEQIIGPVSGENPNGPKPF